MADWRPVAVPLIAMLVSLAGAPASAAVAAPQSGDAPSGVVAAYVLSGAHEGPQPPPPDDPALPADSRAHLRRFRDAARRMVSRLVPPAAGIDVDGKDGFLPRQAIERACVALFGEAVSREAAAYARDAVFWWEYEGAADGPIAESEYAARYLERHPATPLHPYLHLFLARRARVVFEIANAAGNIAQRDEAARAYRRHLSTAQTSGHPVIALAAADLDRARFVYLRGSAHP